MAIVSAILRAYWLSSRVGGGRGAVFGAITAVLWYGLWTGAAVAAGVYLGRADPAAAAASVPIGMLLVFIYWQVIPVVSASMGAGLTYESCSPIPCRMATCL